MQRTCSLNKNYHKPKLFSGIFDKPFYEFVLDLLHDWNRMTQSYFIVGFSKIHVEKFSKDDGRTVIKKAYYSWIWEVNESIYKSAIIIAFFHNFRIHTNLKFSTKNLMYL